MIFAKNIETFLQYRKISFQTFLLLTLFMILVVATIIFSLITGNISVLLIVSMCSIVCLLLSKQIKTLEENNNVINFQKKLTSSGFDASMFAFFIFSENGRCVFINRVAQNLFPGFKIKTIEDFILCFGKYPKIIEAINTLQISLKNNKQNHIDLPMNFYSDNTALWRIAVSPLPENKGFSAWTIIDLTPSNSQIISLENSSSFLLNLLNHSSVAYFSIAENNDIIFCNNTFSYWLGVKNENIIGKQYRSFININQSDPLPLNDERGTLTHALPSKLSLKSEIIENIDVVAREIFKTTDNVRTYILTKDSQQSGDLVQELGKTKLYFEHIFEDAPVGILITDGAETISACNRTFKNIIGVNSIDNTSFIDYIPNEEKENVREKLYSLIGAVYKSITPFEIQFSHDNSKTVMVYASKIAESNRTNKDNGLVLYFIDISERKELQHQFVQSQKMQAVGQLAGGVAHDFNNLLTAMIGYCDLLLEKYLPSDQSFNDIMQIKQNANRASNLVRQLLAFSRQQTLQPKVLNVADMLSELSALLRRLLGAKVELQVSHGRNIGFVKVDQIQFEQVIINLAVNARDAMSDGGILTIKTSSYTSKESKFLRGDTMPPGEYVLIEVIDTGCGIDDTYLNRIFDPFFSTKEKGHGTGLGLSTVYGIVNQTGGFISVESEKNIGTKFSLYFPMYQSKDVIDNSNNLDLHENKITDLTGTATILLVEDEEAVRMFSSRALRDKGYKVIEASNGEIALEYLKNESGSIDLVITDVVMPKMDGPTLMEHIKSYTPKMKVIFISGYTEDNFRESLANDTKVHFLSKPFNLKELARKVKEVI